MSNVTNELAAEIAAMEKRLVGLKQAYAILAGGATQGVSAPTLAASSAVKPRKRAPGGYLEDCLIKVLGAETMSNEAMRIKLVEGGYPYAVTPMHVSKALTKLVKAKKLKAVGPKSQRKYHQP